ncbi:MAG: hypothetical protein EBU88_10855 [Acidobacteria bacterium]|nr:hypothetical protein [Acidobacteriota bacterium]
MKSNQLGINIKPQLGGDIEAYCGKCKDTREHVIAALDASGNVERVQCRTCQGNHAFRLKSTKAASTRSSSGKSVKPTKKDSVLEPDGSGPLRPYSMQDRFTIGDRIEHPKFGVGVVMEVRFGKIDVKFGREQRTLVHGG